MKPCDQPIRRMPPARMAGTILPLCLGVMLATIAGCLSPTSPQDGDSLTRHNWWNFYARGAQALKQGRVAEAADDFRRSLGTLSGARFGDERDRWRARTYGLHFVEGYFPNRELGVCLYELQDAAGAIPYLERSLQQTPSGRAKHYLNLARGRQLAGRAVDEPRLRIDGEAAASSPTRERTLRITGLAEGAGYVRRLEIGGRAEYIELATPTLPFARQVSLAEGTNAINVTVEDLLGNRTTRQILRIADWQPPSVLVRTISADGAGWLVEGVCRDVGGVSAILVNGEAVFRAAGPGPATEVPLALKIPSDGATLSVTDVAGNPLTVPLSGAQAPRAGAAGRRFGGPVAWASGFTHFLAQTLDGGGERLIAGIVPTGTAAPATATGDEPDRLRPSLVLRGCQPLVRVYAEDFFVDGIASDGGGLARVTVNGENLLAGNDVGMMRTYFSRRLALDLGTNCFEIAAIDRSGNRAAQTVTVIRFLAEHLDPRYRLTVGVPPLMPAEAGPTGIRVKRRMEAELTREPIRFRLLERDEGWDYVLREQGLSLSDLADPAAALRIGKLVPAELLLMGTVFSEAKGITVFLRAVETENGEIVFSSDVYCPDPEAALDDAVAGLVLKVGQGFPLVSGEVWKRQGARVVLNVGLADGTTEQCRFLVFDAADAETPGAGRICKAEGRPVQLQIEKLQQTTSTARVLPAAAEGLVKEGCHVYTR